MVTSDKDYDDECRSKEKKLKSIMEPANQPTHTHMQQNQKRGTSLKRLNNNPETNQNQKKNHHR